MLRFNLNTLTCRRAAFNIFNIINIYTLQATESEIWGKSVRNGLQKIARHFPSRTFRFCGSIKSYQPGCTATEMIPTIEMIPATEMTPNIPIRNRNDPLINFRNLGLNGLGTFLSILNCSFIHANTILNRGK